MGTIQFAGLIRGATKLSLHEIASIPGVAAMPTITRTSIGDAVPAAAVMAAAKPTSEAAFCTVVSTDGAYSASIPLADLVDGGWLAFRLDGAPLPAEHGGPLRLTVALGKTLCWNVKDVGEMRFTSAKEPDSVPARPEH